MLPVFMADNPNQIVRKKLVNITKEMDAEIKLRMEETGRTEMKIFQDAILMKNRLSPMAQRRLQAYAKEHGVSLERASDMWLAEISQFLEGRNAKSKK